MHPSGGSEGGALRAMRRLPLIVIASFGLCATAAATALAQSPTVIVKVHQSSGLVSPYFQLAAKPGRTVDAGSLELVNPTSRSITVRLDPVDAITTDTLGSAYSLSTGSVHGAATWLRLARRQVVIRRHASTDVPVSLAVPAIAAPGDYLGGVSVEALGQTRSAKVTRGVAIGETDRYAIGVEATLPGPRHPAVGFTGANVAREPAGLAFHVNAVNAGNVILKNVRGWVRVTAGKRLVAAATIQPGTFVSGTSISYPLAAPREQPAPGASYRVRAALHYAGRVARLDTRVVFSHASAVRQQSYGGRKLPKSGHRWEWLLLLALALVVLVAGAGMARRRRRPLSRAAGLKLLGRHLGPSGSRPVSVALITAPPGALVRIARSAHPLLRRGDRICALGRGRLLLICPTMPRTAANALKRELERDFARYPELARASVQITLATANKPTTAQKLLGRVMATELRRHQAPPRARARRATTVNR